MGTIINGEKLENVYIAGNRIKGFAKSGNIVYKEPPCYLLEWTDTNNVEYIQRIPEFQLYNVLVDLNNRMKTCKVTSLNGAQIMDCSLLFNYFNYLESVDLSEFDTSSAVTMANMFSNCSRLKYINLSNLDTNEVQSMSNMFNYCTSLEKLDLTSFNIENVTNMQMMFYRCRSLSKLDLSNFFTKSLRITSFIFYECNKLMYLDLSNFDFSKVNNFEREFEGIPADCLIYVKDQNAKDFVLNRRSDLTNVQIKN